METLTTDNTQEAVKERVDIVLDLGAKAHQQVRTDTKHLLVLGAHLGFRSLIRNWRFIRLLRKADRVANEALNIAAEEILQLRKRVAELENEVAKLRSS